MAAIIDAHIHVGSWEHPGFLGRSCDLRQALAVLGAAGVDGAAIVPTDQVRNQELLDQARERIAGGFEGPLWFFGWVRAQDADGYGAGDLDWVSDNIDSVTGIKIHPSLSRRRITDPEFADALQLADREQLVVLVHCGRWQEVASYRFAVQAAQRYPRARFLLAHAGGDTPEYATAAAELVAAESVDNVWFEFSGLREYWVIERNVALLGAERYLMGSDYSLAHPLMYIGAVQGMDLDDLARRRILGLNALELFGEPLSR